MFMQHARSCNQQPVRMASPSGNGKGQLRAEAGRAQADRGTQGHGCCGARGCSERKPWSQLKMLSSRRKAFLKKSGEGPQLGRPRRMGTGRAPVCGAGRIEGI